MCWYKNITTQTRWSKDAFISNFGLWDKQNYKSLSSTKDSRFSPSCPKIWLSGEHPQEVSKAAPSHLQTDLSRPQQQPVPKRQPVPRYWASTYVVSVQHTRRRGSNFGQEVERSGSWSVEEVDVLLRTRSESKLDLVLEKVGEGMAGREVLGCPTKSWQSSDGRKKMMSKHETAQT